MYSGDSGYKEGRTTHLEKRLDKVLLHMQVSLKFMIKLELCRAHTPRALYSHCSIVLQHNAAELFYDLTTLSNTELEHAQSHQHAKTVGVVDKPQAC